MIGAIFIVGSFCVIGIVLRLFDGWHYIKVRILEEIGIMLIVGVVLIFIAGVILEIELWESRVIANGVIFGILLFIVTEYKRKKRK